MQKTSHGWVGLVYVWDDNAKDGVLDLDSESIEFSLTHKGDVYSGIYRVPSFGSCANCHQYNSEMIPIGPKARLLNKPISYDGEADLLAQLDTFDPITNTFSEHYGQIPVGLEMHIIFVTEDAGAWRWAIQGVTVAANDIYTITYAETVTGTKAQMIAAIQALP